MKFRKGTPRLSSVARFLCPLLFACVGHAAPVPSVTRVLSTPNPVVQGQAVVLVAGVNATESSYPTGTITISDSCAGVSSPTVTNLGTVTLGAAGSPSPGSGTLNINIFPCLGQNTIVGQYSGDRFYAPSTSASLIETVLDQFTPVSTSLTSSANPVLVGQPVTFNSILTYSLTQNSHATGTVTFTDLNTSTVLGSGTVQTIGAGRQLITAASFTTSAMAAGSYAVQATYSGDNIYGSGTSQVLNQVVQQSTTEPTTTALTASATAVNLGDSVTLNAQVTSMAGTPTGSLTFLDGSSILASVNLDGNGQGSLTTSSLTLGTHSITAAYGGSSQFSISTSGASTVTVNPVPLTPTTTTLISSENPAVTGDSITFSAAVTSSGTGTLTGTVTFQDTGSSANTVVLGVVTLQNGAVSLSVKLSADTHQITATYSGDTNFSGSSASLTESVNPPNIPPTTTALISSANPSTYGQAVSFIATVTGSAGTPTGLVTFNDGFDSFPVGLDNTGTAVLTVAAFPAGSLNLNATYSGDSANAGSSSPTLVQTVGAASTTTTVTSSANPIDPNTSVTFTAAVTVVAPGSGTPTGTFSFQVDGTSLQCDSVAVQQDGTAACATSELTSGDHTISVSYSGDSNFLPSTGSITQTVNTPTLTNQLVLSDTALTHSATSNLFWAKFTITNNGSKVVPGAIKILFNGLPAGVTLQNASGSMNGAPYILLARSLTAAQAASFPVMFVNPSLIGITFTPSFLAGVTAH